MTPEEVNDMWRQSQDDVEGTRLGYTTGHHYFAALVAAHEREAMEIFCNACAGFEFDPNMKHAFKVVAARLKQGRQG